MTASPTVPAVTVRVLWVIKGLGPGGAERLLVNHAAVAGPDMEYSVLYVVPEKDQLVPELEALNVTVTCDAASRPTSLGWIVR